MYKYRYVKKNETAPVKEELLKIIHKVQNIVRDDFTFRYNFIGSSSRNMITQGVNSNIGFDFDVNFQVNDLEENYSAAKIKQKLINAFNLVVPIYGYKDCEDSTRVITIKFIDRPLSRILHSCDIAVVRNYIDISDEQFQQYIRFNKAQNSYCWAKQPKPSAIEKKAEWLKKQQGAWNAVKTVYLNKKNNNVNPEKHSRSLYAETIHEVCQQYGYYNH